MLSVALIFILFYGLHCSFNTCKQAEKRRRARSDNNIDFTAQQQILTMVIIDTN